MAASTEIMPFNFTPIDDASPPCSPARTPVNKGRDGQDGNRRGPGSNGSQFSDWDAGTPSPLRAMDKFGGEGNGAGGVSGGGDNHGSGAGGGGGSGAGGRQKESPAEDSLELSGFESMSSTELFGLKRAAVPNVMETPTHERRVGDANRAGSAGGASAGGKSEADSSQFSDWDADVPSPTKDAGVGGGGGGSGDNDNRGGSLATKPTLTRACSPAGMSTGASGGIDTAGATPHTTEPMHTVSTSATSGVVSAFRASADSLSSGGGSTIASANTVTRTSASTEQPQQSAAQPHVYPHRPRPPPRQLKRGRSCPKTKFAHTPKSKSIYTFVKGASPPATSAEGCSARHAARSANHFHR